MTFTIMFDAAEFHKLSQDASSRGTLDAIVSDEEIKPFDPEKNDEVTSNDEEECKDFKDGQSDNLCRLYLWYFLLELLTIDGTENIISWTNKETLEFKIHNAKTIALMWGNLHGRENMTYAKFSRALRYHYKKGVMKKVQKKRYCYQFLKCAKVQYVMGNNTIKNRNKFNEKVKREVLQQKSNYHTKEVTPEQDKPNGVCSTLKKSADFPAEIKASTTQTAQSYEDFEKDITDIICEYSIGKNVSSDQISNNMHFVSETPCFNTQVSIASSSSTTSCFDELDFSNIIQDIDSSDVSVENIEVRALGFEQQMQTEQYEPPMPLFEQSLQQPSLQFNNVQTNALCPFNNFSQHEAFPTNMTVPTTPYDTYGTQTSFYDSFTNSQNTTVYSQQYFNNQSSNQNDFSSFLYSLNI